MTTQQNRVDRGIPTAGQWSASKHAEPDVNLAPERRPELEGWPENLPEPQLDFDVDDEGKISTTVTVEGHGSVTTWIDNSSTGRTDYDITGDDFESLDEETVDAVTEWASKKHLEVEGNVHNEMMAAADRARAAINAKATGSPAAVTDEQLEEMIEANSAGVHRAQRDFELGSASLMSRKILEAHPDAARAVLDSDGSEDGEWIAQVSVLNDRGEKIEEYDDPDSDIDEDILRLASNLSPNANTSHWSRFTVRTEGFNLSTFQNDTYTINLDKAAAWSPGGEA